MNWRENFVFLILLICSCMWNQLENFVPHSQCPEYFSWYEHYLCGRRNRYAIKFNMFQRTIELVLGFDRKIMSCHSKSSHNNELTGKKYWENAVHNTHTKKNTLNNCFLEPIIIMYTIHLTNSLEFHNIVIMRAS